MLLSIPYTLCFLVIFASMVIYDIKDNKIIDAVLTEGAEQEQELGKSDFVKLSWESDTKVTIPAGAYIIPFDDGLKYRMLDGYTPAETDKGFKYEPQFHHPLMLLSRIPFLYDATDADKQPIRQQEWSYEGLTTNALKEACKAINEALGITEEKDKFTYTLCGNVDASVSFSVSSNDILSVLSSIAQACKTNTCEWHLSWEHKALYFGQVSINLGEEVPTLKVHDNINTASVNSSKEVYYNCFYPQGSTKNMSRKALVGTGNVATLARLGLDKSIYPDGCIYIDTEGNIATKEVFEASKAVKQTLALSFDDIYPHIDLYAYNIRKRTRFLKNNQTNKIELDSNGNKKTYTIWYMRLAYPSTVKISGKEIVNTTQDKEESGKTITHYWYDYEIDRKKQILQGYTLKGIFKVNTHTSNSQYDALSQSLVGQPNGQEGFELYHHDEKSYDIPASSADGDSGVSVLKGDYEIKMYQSGDIIIPTNESEGLYPRGKEKPDFTCNIVVLFNIVMGEYETKKAQKELAARTIKEISRRTQDNNNYSFSSNAVEFARHNPNLRIGQKVNFDDGFGYKLSTRIIKLVTKIDYPIIQDITVGNQAIKGTISQLKENVNNILSGNFTGGGLNNSQVSELVKNYTASRFLRKDIPDTADELITFLSGIALKNNTGIDGEGNARLRKVVAEVLQSDDFKKGLLGGKGVGIYDELGSKVMELDKLLVRQKMIIQELEIRKLSYVGGDQVFSSAGSKVVKVKTLLNGDFRCYILADDGTTRTMNDWRIGDQAQFKTDNIKEGVYKNVSNRYYWRLVVNRGEEWMLGDALRRKIGTMSIGAANHITYTLPEDAYFSGKDIDGFSAYAVTVEIEGNKAKYYKMHVLKGFYPKGTGVLIKGEAGKHDIYTYDVPHENIIPDNWLIGTEQDTTLVGNEESYILQYNNGRVYFARVASDSVLSAGKAYFNIRHGIATLSNGVTANVTPKLYNYVDLSNTRGALDITGEDGKTYTCIGYDLSVENDIPLAEDSIVQLGNQIDKERQYAYIIYVSERKRVDYTGINDYDLSSHETEKHSAEGGFIRSDRFVIEGYGGVSAPLVCDRGKWAYGMSCGHYDRVSHNGSLWLCMVEKGKTTTEEPSDSSPLWLKQVEKGEHPIKLDIISDRGNIIRNGQGNVVLKAMVTKNGEDITDTFPDSAFSWSRDSGNAEYDKEWNNRHKGVGRIITVSAQDIFRKATFECILNF